MTRIAGLGLLALLQLAGCDARTDGHGARATPWGGEIGFRPCALEAARRPAVEAQCASIAVPENHDEPDGRTIELAIALVAAEGIPEPDPVVMIAGGPGQSALQAYPQLHTAFADVRRNRNVLLVDARGTGGSNPLKCRAVEDSDAMPGADASSPEAARAFAERCRDELAATADLRHYATGDQVRDLELVRRKLGIDRLDLYGVSYGTRVAQQYAKRYPQATRTVTLDSPVPNSLVLGQEHARNLDAALKQQFARCRSDSACARNLGDPQADLAALQERLRTGGLAPVAYRDPLDGEWRSDVPSYGHLATLLRLYSYQPEAASMLPLIVHDATRGRYESLLAQVRSMISDVSSSIAHGMELSVICTEDTELAPDPADAATLLGTELVDFARAQCSVWPKGVRAPDFRAPLAGEMPALVLSGELDPVTPPRYGAEIVAALPRGRHLVLPGQGHAVIAIGCMPKLFAQFIENANAAALDDSCLARLTATPPFAGRYGWEP